MTRRTMVRISALAVLLVVAVTAFFVFYHPPMRLMPPPLLFQGQRDAVTGRIEELGEGSRLSVFYATSRLPVGPRDNRLYTVAPDTRLHLGTADLRIGGEETTLADLVEWTAGYAGGDRPFVHLDAMREAATVGEPEVAAWLDGVRAALAASGRKDLLVYVHGANTTVERAAGQAAMLQHFGGGNLVVVAFVWPTAENFLRYGRDVRNAFAAGPHLAELIAMLARETGAEGIDVMTYSAGGTVGSTGLAVLARDYPDQAGMLGQVYHAAPDADFRGFVEDLAAYSPVAAEVTVAANMGDSALRLAQTVNRASRAGRPDLRELSPEAGAMLLGATEDGMVDLLQVLPDEMPDLPASSHTFWYDDPWVSNDLFLMYLFGLDPAARGLERRVTAAGAPVWTFGADYVERMRALAPGLGLPPPG
ncbi:alpha/beta hydrolase [Neotabrizicola shimadae]|uniref:Alpha/beta hydrolase n=1 Tax=Neotabrizicola shimadae TaxID=2807096 RepID=A0A8G0ZXR9_9RHOB|nr:alpha/beta hydrolase [Neotabrizicola shimadae]QYZ70688.1 alpha/beta hydrolase [Neotabrizicola shimadae]